MGRKWFIAGLVITVIVLGGTMVVLYQIEKSQLASKVVTRTWQNENRGTYTSPAFKGQQFRTPLPPDWMAKPYSEHIGNSPLNNALGVEFHRPDKQEWTWAEPTVSDRIVVSFEENKGFTGPVEQHPEVKNNPRVQMVTNHFGLRLANLTDGRVLLNFPGNNICVFKLVTASRDETPEVFNEMVMNLEILK